MDKKLENVSDAARRHALGYNTINKLLKELAPLAMYPFSRGHMRLYDAAEIDRVVAEYLKKREAKKTPSVADVAPPVLQGPVAATVLSKLDAVESTVAALMEQNSAEFSAFAAKLDAMQAAFTARLDATQEAVTELATRPSETVTAPLPLPERAVEPASEPTRRRPRVRILGLHDNKVDLIQREFGRSLDLNCVNPDRALSAASSGTTADATFVMVDFVNHKVTNTMDAINTPYTLVRGGLTTLRSALTELATTEQVAA